MPGMQRGAGRHPGSRQWLSLPQVFVKVGSQTRDDPSTLCSIIHDELLRGSVSSYM